MKQNTILTSVASSNVCWWPQNQCELGERLQDWALSFGMPSFFSVEVALGL